MARMHMFVPSCSILFASVLNARVERRKDEMTEWGHAKAWDSSGEGDARETELHAVAAR